MAILPAEAGPASSMPFMFTPLPTLSSGSTQPSSAPTPTHSVPISAPGSSESTSSSTLILCFIIVFLSLFGIFIIGGMAWQRYIMLRRARLQALEDVIKELTLKGQQPKLWDIRVSSEGERSYNWNNIFASDF